MIDSSINIIRASSKDIELAFKAIKELHMRVPMERDAVSYFINDPSCYLLLAISDTDIIGSLNGYSLRHPHICRPQFLLYEIDVNENHRGKGIGQALVNKFLDEARIANAFEVWVLSNESNIAAIEMYKKCGFQSRNRDDVMLSISIE